MKFSTATVAATTFLAGSAMAAPATRCDPASNMASKIAAYAPESTACAADATADCRTNKQVAPLAAKAMSDYGLTTAGEMAAVLALTALESEQYKYSHNLFPGRPGQGTSNMQMFEFNLKYAQSIPEVKAKLAGVKGLNLKNPDSSTDKAKNEVLDFLTVDKYNFGSAQWYLTTQCEPSIKENLKTGSDAAWKAYMVDCVGTTMAPERNAYWEDAKKAFGVK